MSTLEINNLSVSVEGKAIIHNISLIVKSGEIHAIMGPNGSGKSTLAFALMGHPKYKITSGKVLLDGKNILEMPVNERAKTGLFLSFQNPLEVQGAEFSGFIRTAYNALHKEQKQSVFDFRSMLENQMASLEFDRAFASRGINEGFSGGEKKRAEVLQMELLKPKFAILDEIDSGLDVDALKLIAKNIKNFVNPNTGILAITHYQRLLDYLQPNYVHILFNGRIVKSGGPELAKEIENTGYDQFNLIQIK